MATQKWSAIKARRMNQETIAKVRREADEELLRLNLSQLREASGKTQVEVAELVQVTQSQLSRFENRDDHKLSTLRRYVEALGGQVEVVAVLDNKRITLVGV